MAKKKYKNILEFAKENNVYDKLCEDVGRSLEDYLDDYSDRNIVELVMCDLRSILKRSGETLDFKVFPKWHKHEGYLIWQETKIEITK